MTRAPLPAAPPLAQPAPRARAWWHLPLLAVLGVLLLGAQVGGSWRYDDPLILQYVQGLPDYLTPFTNAAAWRELGAPFFTPMLTSVFQLAHSVFGVWAAGHYALHLLALLAAAALTYALLAPRTGPTAALGAAALFLLGAPTAVVAAQLMDTHYVWGLVLALLATLAWRRFVHNSSGQWRARGWGWAAASSALYLLAVLSKEIFAPLPLVLWVLAGKRRWRWMGVAGLAGHAAIAILYLPWRRTMLGSTTGGYGGGQTGWDSVAASVPALAQAFWGQGWPAWVATACALVLAARALLGPGRVGWGLLASALFALLLPFGFVTATADATHLRLAFLPWWALCVLVGCALRTWQQPPPGSPRATGPVAQRMAPVARAWPWAAFALLAAATLVAQQRTQSVLAAETRVYDAYARHAMAPPAGATWALLQGRAATDPHFQYGLARMALRQGLPQTTVHAFEAQARYASHTTPATAGGPTGYAYSSTCQCMAPLASHPATPAVPAGAATTPPTPPTPPAAMVAPVEAAGALTLQMHAPAPHGLQWHFSAPEAGGDWYLQVPRLHITLQFPASGAIGFPTPPWLLREEFRVIWRGSSGAWAQTPPLAFPALGHTVRF